MRVITILRSIFNMYSRPNVFAPNVDASRSAKQLQLMAQRDEYSEARLTTGGDVDLDESYNKQIQLIDKHLEALALGTWSSYREAVAGTVGDTG